MEWKQRWAAAQNPETGPQFEEFRRYLYALNDGTMDVERCLGTAYGEELARRLAVRCAIQNDWQKAQAYYQSLGLRCEFHHPEAYYDRWKLFVPQGLAPQERRPIFFWNHGGGNSIESEETMTGYLQLAGRERFFLVMAQNTNPDWLLSILDQVAGRYPVDLTRVYLGGFSQGAAQCHSFYTHYPDRIAAVALTCTDIWRPWDNFDNRYTQEELANLRRAVVPISLQVGQCEPFPFAPLNDWHKNRMNPIPREQRGRPDDFEHPGKIQDKDPTRITAPGKGRYDPGKPNVTRMASMYEPRPDEDVHVWGVERVNRRLELLGCEPRDVRRCAGFFFQPEDELHHTTGIYGDEEEIRELYGVKHSIVRIKDRGGTVVFQYIVTANAPHWPPVTAAELGWAFVKQFCRNAATGKSSPVGKESEADNG